MKNTFKKVLVISLVLLTVLTLFIACNENNDNIVTSIKKPTAKPDPNNPYDKLSSYKKYTEDDITDDTTIHITLTNSESLNNLFYDYTVEDFGDEYFKSISENCTENLSVARNAYNGVNDSYIPDFKTYLRGFNLTLKNPGKHQLLECIDYLIEKDEIRIAEPLYVNKITWFSTTPNDTYLSNQWALDKIQAYDAWDKTTGSSEVRVGLIDSGINNTHEDLSANISTTLSYGTNPYEDVAPHGTMTAGVIGAVGNNNKGISGVCWNVDIVSLKAVNSSGEEDPTEMANAINYAQTNHIPIVNFSGGFYQNNDEKIESLRAAIQSYTGLVIVSAGNEGYNLDDENVQLYPQCFDLANILVVGATDSNDAIYSTNYGATTVDLFAPGASIYTTTKAGSYAYKSGTSFSAPFVTGVAALIKTLHPTITTAQLKATILNNVDKIDSLTNYCVSGGRLNAKKSVENIVHSHDRTTTTYVNLGYSQGHTETCSICDYSATTFHTWIKLTTGGLTTGYKCIGCNAYYKNIQIIHPVDGIIGADTNTLQEGNNTIIQISQHILLLCQNGQYSLLVQCDENMNISEDVLYEVPISWIRDILIANR